MRSAETESASDKDRAWKVVVRGLARVLALASATLPVCVTLAGSAAWNGGTAASAWNVDEPLGQTRVVEFTTDEGTWMSVDISPDSEWIAFDLLGHVYRIPAEGGAAQCLTCDSPASTNFHPRFSPDGRRIAFISDRRGQENIWVMSGEGKDARPVFLDSDSKLYDPVWAPDGQAILATRVFPYYYAHFRPRAEIWRLPLSGEKPSAVAIPRNESTSYRWPSISPDGNTLYYFTSYLSMSSIGVSVGHFVQEKDLKSGDVSFVRPHPDEPVEPDWNPYGSDDLKGGLHNSTPPVEEVELAPEISPDGRHLAYVSRRPGMSIRFRGHEFGPANMIVLRDLQSGEEMVGADSITIDLARAEAGVGAIHKVVPGYAWAKDGKSLIYSEGGKIRRVYLDSGEVRKIPFNAQVRRTLSETPRSKVKIDDTVHRVHYLQWPSGSPDGQRVAIIAAGRMYVADLAIGRTTALADMPPDVVQITPAWSPDGSKIAFATWSNSAQGHLWTVSPDGGKLKRLTHIPGQYAHPAWLPDSRRLVVAQGPGTSPPPEWQGWDAPGQWKIMLIDEDGRTTELVRVAGETQPSVGREGRIHYYERQHDSMAALSVAIDGSDKRREGEVYLPPTGLRAEIDSLPKQNLPLISPDGGFVAYDAAHDIYVEAIDRSGEKPFSVNGDPNRDDAAQVRIGNEGGLYHRWRDAETLEFVGGSHYVTYDVATGTLVTREVVLEIPRATTAPGSVALVRARIITGDGSTVIDEGSIVVEDGRITCVGECAITDRTKLIDAFGKTIMPGLIDVHDHSSGSGHASLVNTTFQPKMAARLAYGVTTRIEAYATLWKSDFAIAEMVEAGLVLGPRMLSVADALSDFDALGWQKRISDLEDARRAVRQRLNLGATSIKNYHLNTRAQQQMLLEAAREYGVTVTGEVQPLHRNIGAIVDGQLGIEHMLGPVRIYKDVSMFYGLAGSVYSATLSAAGHPWQATHYYGSQHDLHADPKFSRFLPRNIIEEYRVRTVVPAGQYSIPLVAEGVKDFVAAGGRAALGSHGNMPAIGSHWDMWAFVGAVSPLQAIRFSTYEGAYFHGLEDELGTLEPGKVADLLVLNSSPLENIENSIDILYVMKAGRLYDAATLDEIWPESRHYRPFVTD